MHQLKALVECADSQTGQHDSCQAGMARSCLHMGDTKQGRALALDSNSPQLCKECAQILEAQDKQQVLPDMQACQHNQHPTLFSLLLHLRTRRRRKRQEDKEEIQNKKKKKTEKQQERKKKKYITPDACRFQLERQADLWALLLW